MGLTMGSKGLMLGCAALALAGCTEADVASQNLSKAADQFEINRRITFTNTWADKALLTIEGLCSLGNDDKPGQRTVTCKVGPGQYKKHTLGLSANVTWFSEQIEPAKANTYHYRVILAPSVLIPGFELR